MNYAKIIIAVALFMLLNCTEKNELEENQIQFSKLKEIKAKQKHLPKFEELKYNRYIIRYSNVIIEIKGKKIKVPIYGGIYGDIELVELEKKQKDKNTNLLGNIFIPIEKGHATETFIDILNFYKKSFFKSSFFKKFDTNKPTLAGGESSWNYIWYDFEYEGFPSCMLIIVDLDEEKTDKIIESKGISIYERDAHVEMFQLNENSDYIGISIGIGNSTNNL